METHGSRVEGQNKRHGFFPGMVSFTKSIGRPLRLLSSKQKINSCCSTNIAMTMNAVKRINHSGQ